MKILSQLIVSVPTAKAAPAPVQGMGASFSTSLASAIAAKSATPEKALAGLDGKKKSGPAQPANTLQASLRVPDTISPQTLPVSPLPPPVPALPVAQLEAAEAKLGSPSDDVAATGSGAGAGLSRLGSNEARTESRGSAANVSESPVVSLPVATASGAQDRPVDASAGQAHASASGDKIVSPLLPVQDHTSDISKPKAGLNVVGAVNAAPSVPAPAATEVAGRSDVAPQPQQALQRTSEFASASDRSGKPFDESMKSGLAGSAEKLDSALSPGAPAVTQSSQPASSVGEVKSSDGPEAAKTAPAAPVERVPQIAPVGGAPAAKPEPVVRPSAIPVRTPATSDNSMASVMRTLETLPDDSAAGSKTPSAAVGVPLPAAGQPIASAFAAPAAASLVVNSSIAPTASHAERLPAATGAKTVSQAPSPKPAAAAPSSDQAQKTSPIPAAITATSANSFARTGAESAPGMTAEKTANVIPAVGDAAPRQVASTANSKGSSDTRDNSRDKHDPAAGTPRQEAAPSIVPGTVQAVSKMDEKVAIGEQTQTIANLSADGAVFGQNAGSAPSAPATISPLAAADAGNAAAANSQPAAALPHPELAAAPAVNNAQLVQSMNHSEMRLGMQSAEFGNISISTSLNHQALSAQISLDHSELGRALSIHLPAIEEKLGSAYGLQARVELRDSGQNASTHSNSGQQFQDRAQEQRQGQGTRAGRPEIFGSETASTLPLPASTTTFIAANDSRLDIRI